jgi:cytochrome c
MKQNLQIISITLLIAIGTPLALTRERVNPRQQADDRLVDATASQQDPQELARNAGCLRCHAIDKKVVGPPFRAVAERYKDDARARKALFDTVKKGGKGNWTELTGDVPMPPHSARLSAAEIQRLVDWVLSLHDGESK